MELPLQSMRIEAERWHKLKNYSLWTLKWSPVIIVGTAVGIGPGILVASGYGMYKGILSVRDRRKAKQKKKEQAEKDENANREMESTMLSSA